MRILLFSINFCTSPYPVYPLGMSVVAGALTAAGHEVLQFDALPYGPERWLEAAAGAVGRFHPDVLGVSWRNLDTVDSSDSAGSLFHESVARVRRIRALSSAPLVLGGAGFSLQPEHLLELTGADYGVVGEGEKALVELVSELAAGRRPEARLRRGTGGPQVAPLYVPELIAYYGGETHLIPVQTKRGCPFRCAYCTYPALEGRRVRPRPVAEVLADLEQIREAQPEAMIYFVDAVFNDPGGSWQALVDGLIERNWQLPWTAFLTPSGLTAKDLERMARSGLVTADLGVDGATDETLVGLAKDFTFEAVRRSCQTLAGLGVGISASVMFGGPGETAETIRRGIDNLRALPACSLIYAGIRLLAGTPLLERARQEGQVPPDWDGLRALYYYAPGIDPDRLDAELKSGFAGCRNCVYPPSGRDAELRLLYKFGYPRLRQLLQQEMS